MIISFINFYYSFRRGNLQLKKPVREVEQPVHNSGSLEKDEDNLVYEPVEVPPENSNNSKSAHHDHAWENLHYKVTVLGEMENMCSEPPVEYLTPRNTEWIACDLCIEHGNPTGACTHRRPRSIASNSYQSLILTEGSYPAAYQELVQESPHRKKI